MKSHGLKSAKEEVLGELQGWTVQLASHSGVMKTELTSLSNCVRQHAWNIGNHGRSPEPGVHRVFTESLSCRNDWLHTWLTLVSRPSRA